MAITYTAETAADIFSQRRRMARSAVIHRRRDVMEATAPPTSSGDATDYLTWQNVAAASAALAHAEGVLSVYDSALDIATRYDGDEALQRLQRYALSVLSSPVGDTYSGQINDARRAYINAQREAASGIVQRSW